MLLTRLEKALKASIVVIPLESLSRDELERLMIVTIVKFMTFFILASTAVQIAAEVQIEPSRVIANGVIDVSAGRYSSLNYKLKKGDRLLVDIKVTGGMNDSLKFWFLDHENYSRYNQGHQFSFSKNSSGEILNGIKLTIGIPQDDIYHLVFDNTDALIYDRKVKANIITVSSSPTERSKAEHVLYSRMYEEVFKKVFIFEDFNIIIKSCGYENAFSNPNIQICREMIDNNIAKGFGDVNMFIFFHELGHSLLKLWNYPLYDNEDVADEFATVIAHLFGQEKILNNTVDYWQSRANVKEAIDKFYIDDRHSISPQRARNIYRWARNPEDLLSRWQQILIPNMHKEALEKILTEDSFKPWLDVTLVKEHIKRLNSH